MQNYMSISQNKITLILILGSLTAFGPLSMDMYLPALPTVASDLYTTTSNTQLSLTACLIGLAFGQLLFGPLSDQIGRRKPLLVSLSIYAIASLLCGLTSSIELLILLRFIQGFSGSAGIVIARASTRDLYSGKELTKFIALLALVNGAAPILAPIFGGVLLRFAPWHTIFYTLAVVGTIMLLIVLFKLPETLAAENRRKGGFTTIFSSFPIIFKDHLFMRLATIQALIMTSMFAYIAGSPFVLQKMYSLSAQGFSASFAINGLGIIIATQVTARLAVYIAEEKLMKMGVTIISIASVFLLFVAYFELPTPYLFIALFFIVAPVGIVTTTAFSLAMQGQSKHAGSASALLGLMPYIGGAIVSPLVGIAGDTTAIPMAIVIFLCSASAFILLFISFERKKSVFDK